ncbi:hypothetical protein B0H14DRAFT_2180401, partial [Mycena olivaceomarginata]
RWRDAPRRRNVVMIVKKQIPEWPDGLYLWQLDFVLSILDDQDSLCCTATGDAKSALFAVPII